MKPTETWPDVALLLALLPLVAGVWLCTNGDGANGFPLVLASAAGGMFVLVTSWGRRSRRGG